MSKILIVEDEIIIRTALRKLLSRNKYDVKEAASVKEATGKYNLDSFDLIISDLRLPGAPGTDLIQMAGACPHYDELCQPAFGCGLHAHGRGGLHCQTF